MKNRSDFSIKPYNRCLTCHHRRVRCDGPRTSAMELNRWCEFMRDMKEVNGLTNEYIAEVTGLSIKTITRLMSPNSEQDQDIMRDTARKIEDAIIGSSNQYPCYLAFEESTPDTTSQLSEATRELERALADNRDYRKALDDIHASYQLEMDKIRSEAQETIVSLREQIRRLQADNDNLWAENNRKSKIVDMFLAKQDFQLVKKDSNA